MNNDFAVFILTHGRPDKVYTYETLRKNNYTGKIYLIIDDEDKFSDQYNEKFGSQVIKFEKKFENVDLFDNFDSKYSVTFARNICFEIARNLNIKYFLQLDDDYTGFQYKLLIDKPINADVKNFDKLFSATLDFYKSINAKSIAFAQGGDFIGGIDNGQGTYRFSKRKAMNSFFCSTDRPFKFIGRVNEDVNTYIDFQSKGNVFLTICNISVIQKTTQKSSGGWTEFYLDNGTYVKSFYTTICSPNCNMISLMKSKHPRLHHSFNWNFVAPMIIKEKYKKNVETLF